VAKVADRAEAVVVHAAKVVRLARKLLPKHRLAMKMSASTDPKPTSRPPPFDFA
jgi:hypothetical protein